MGEAYPKERQLAAENKPRKNRCLLQTAEPASDDCLRCEAAPRPQLRLMSFATEVQSQSSVRPPLTASFWPVMKSALLEARKTTASAISSGLPKWASGVCAR